MELLNATKLAFSKYATFGGRTTRADYWYFFLVLVIATAAFSVFSDDLATFISVITIVPLAAASARRLRDTGMSMANFFWLLLPVAGLIVFLIQLAQPAREAK
jgi:uncharacterized membrane protein YhaH (DUF805 family)